MTLEQLFTRFLKENGLYDYLASRRKKMIRDYKESGYTIPEREKSLIREYLSAATYSVPNPLDLFSMVFSSSGLFNYYSTSPERRRYYRLNKKWKDYIKDKVVVQHNIKSGDTISIERSFLLSGKYKVRNVEIPNNKNCKIVYIYNFGKREIDSDLSLFAVEKVNDEDVIINLYFKDDKGNCYGKIEGDYTEILL